MDTKVIYPKVITEEHFDATMLDLYWRMIAERQNMYVRRVLLDQPRPWTTDAILNAEFITNMYRELDPGTWYVIEEILSMPKPEDVIFNVLLYRLMGSQADVHRLIKVPAAKFKLAAYLKATDAIPNGKLFGTAYRVAGYESWGGATKRENIGRMFEALAKEMPTHTAKIKATTNPSELYDYIFSIPGFGEFLAHQISVDLLYENLEGKTVVPFGDNLWAKAGPGAKRGIQQLLKPNVRPRSNLLVMEWLRDNQQLEFEKRSIDMKYLVTPDAVLDPSPEDIHLLSLCNIQSTLCEFFKYARIWTGETKAVRKYVPSENPTPQPKVPVKDPSSVLDQPQLTPPRPAFAKPWAPEEPTLDAESVGDRILSGTISDQTIKETVLAAPNAPQAEFDGQTLTVSSPDGQTTLQITINVFMNGAQPV